MTNSDFGVFYVAAGQKYIDEAYNSAKSLKQINPSLKISLVCDREITERDLFEQIILVEEKVTCRNEGLLFKVKHLYLSSPYRKTLFVDTDTYFTADCADGFNLLNYFDLALVPAPVDTHYPKLDSGEKIQCKPLNTGVILYNKNTTNDLFFRLWLDIYTQKLSLNSKLKESDQTSFVEALMQSKSRLYPLPPEWNARFCFINAFCEPVKILHGYSSNIEKIAKAINQKPNSSRVWIPHLNKCIVFKPYTWKHQLGKNKLLLKLLKK
jgi:hypothetical protein